jgi:glutamine amidotransferase PdxT
MLGVEACAVPILLLVNTASLGVSATVAGQIPLATTKAKRKKRRMWQVANVYLHKNIIGKQGSRLALKSQ